MTKHIPWALANFTKTVTEPVTQPVTEPAPVVPCLACGSEVRQQWNGRPRQYCNAACRQRAYRRRKRLNNAGCHNVRRKRK